MIIFRTIFKVVTGFFGFACIIFPLISIFTQPYNIDWIILCGVILAGIVILGLLSELVHLDKRISLLEDKINKKD